LSRAEKLERLHGDMRAPRSAVSSVEVLGNAHRAAMALGFKVGTRTAGVVELAQVPSTSGVVLCSALADTRTALWATQLFVSPSRLGGAGKEGK
jgi:hypothetical protein